MAITITTLSSQFNDITVADTDVDETAKNDITQGTGSVHYIQAVNGWSGSSIFLKLYDATSATLPTDQPMFIMKVAASANKTCVIPDGMAFTNGLSYAAVDQAGDLGAGTPIPTGNLTVRIITS
jgi:hypothetical protein